MSNIEKYADKAMYEAAPMEGKEPGVYLLWMTPDPLGAISAACRMYEGKPTYILSEITDEERRNYAEQIHKTHLKAPLEFVKLHFFIEGVDRAFTHQMVRQRTAVYAQESLRFAVKHNMASEAVLPPSIIQGGPDVQQKFAEALQRVEESYNWLVANGIPAEDARALLPHCVSTRLHFCTDLRNLADHAGNRLCTQAQFHWREVFLKFVTSIREYAHDWSVELTNSWQFPAIADSQLFRPVCYQLGHCGFKANFDRGCTIRDRVDAFEAAGVPSAEWHQVHVGKFGVMHSADLEAINPAEWLANPRAGWVK